jgi:hypothetical protein
MRHGYCVTINASLIVRAALMLAVVCWAERINHISVKSAVDFMFFFQFKLIIRLCF